MSRTLKTILLAGGMSLGLATAANAQIAFSLDENGTTLVSFSPNSGTDAGSVSLTGPDGPISLDAITYRPQTNQLYGYDGSSGTLFTVDITTGVATVEFQSDALPNGFVSFDINPNLDAFRFVNSSGNNVVYFPENTANATPTNAGRLITDEPTIFDLTYADGFEGVEGTPSVLGNGYTNSLPLADAQAQDDALLQYVLDSETNSLAILDNNAGTVDFVADAGFDFDLAGGFDVFTDGDTDIGYGLLTVDGVQSLYAIDLGTFVFSEILGVQSQFGTLTSLAVFDADAVPVPAAAILFLTGAGGLAATRRRKSAAQ